MLKIVLGLALVASAFAQDFTTAAPKITCDCAIFTYPRDWFPPREFGPLHLFPDAPEVEDCGDRGRIDCDAYCMRKFVHFSNNVKLTSKKPGDSKGRTWGQAFCDISRDIMGVVDDAITADLMSYNRRLVCPNHAGFEFVSQTPQKRHCCDQNGKHVDC